MPPHAPFPVFAMDASLQDLGARIDPSRAKRAASLRVEEPRPGQYRVSGTSRGSYYVRLEPEVLCACGDSLYRHVICKHMIAALIQRGHPSVERWRPVSASGSFRAMVGAGGAWSDDCSLEEGLRWLHHRPDDEELLARLITDPEADEEVFVRISEVVESETMQLFLLSVERALRVREVVAAIESRAASVPVCYRLLAGADPEQFRRIWKRILDELGPTEHVLSGLERHAMARRLVTADDLLPFLSSSDDGLRERALALLERVEVGDLSPEALPTPSVPERRRPGR